MKAVHLHTEGVSCCDEAALVEMYVRFSEGVRDVASVREIGLVSVLYDEHRTDPGRIVCAIRSIGFDAQEYVANPLAHAS